jgi:hypothetical protein
MIVREPVLHPVPIVDLRPTQITVGMREVKAKQKSWQQFDKKKRDAFLAHHMIPVVRGPKDRFYVIDHHHLSLAMHNEGVKSLFVIAVADLRTLANDEFWLFMDNRALVHPYDTQGRRRDFEEIPRRVTELKDDPFRSLAGELRRMGGFAKDTTPFSEFIWADYLRRRISRNVAKDDFDSALEQGMKLAKSAQANYLPGWCGAHIDENVPARAAHK